MESDFFDQLDNIQDPLERIKAFEAQQAKSQKLDYLIHTVFSTDEGQELLARWKETLIMTSTADEGADLISVGIKEGYKRFIRAIILTLDKVEKQ